MIILLIYIIHIYIIPTINISSFHFNIYLFYFIISRFAFAICFVVIKLIELIDFVC